MSGKAELSKDAKMALFKSLPIFAEYLAGCASQLAEHRKGDATRVPGSQDVVDALDRVLELRNLVGPLKDKVASGFPRTLS